MFVTASANYAIPVKIDYLNEDGSTKTRVLMCRFKRLSQTEIDALFERASMGNLTDVQVIAEVFRGWTDDTTDEQGNKLEYTPENCAKVMDVYPTRPTIVRAFLDTIQTVKTKNS